MSDEVDALAQRWAPTLGALAEHDDHARATREETEAMCSEILRLRAELDRFRDFKRSVSRRLATKYHHAAEVERLRAAAAEDMRRRAVAACRREADAWQDADHSVALCHVLADEIARLPLRGETSE